MYVLMFMFLMRACILDFYYTNIGLCIAERRMIHLAFATDCGMWSVGGEGEEKCGREHSVSNGKFIIRRAAWHRPRFAAPPNMSLVTPLCRLMAISIL